MHLKNENNVCCFKWHSKFNMKRKTRSRRLFNKQLGHYQTKASSPRVYSNHVGILVRYSRIVRCDSCLIRIQDCESKASTTDPNKKIHVNYTMFTL